MKKLFILIPTLLLMYGCSKKTSDNPELEKLMSLRDSLKSKYEEVGKQLAEVEEQIFQMDTTLKAPLVTLMSLSKGDFSTYFRVQGSVQTDKNAQVFPEIPGLIKTIFVKEGDVVTEGQKLAQIDDNLARIQLQQLELNLQLANDLFEKQEKLWNQKIGSEVQYLQAKNTKSNIEEQIRQMKETLNKYIVNAPFSGTVDQINLREGELGSQMQPLLRVVNLSEMYMKADVSENYIAQVKRGAEVFVFIPNMDTIKTSISRVGNFIKAENRTFEVTVKLPDSEFLKPNLVGSISIADYTVPSTISLKTSLIMHDAEDRPFVFLAVKEGELLRAKKQIIEEGRSYEGYTEVKSGLTGEEQIIEKGARKLVDGQEIRLN